MLDALPRSWHWPLTFSLLSLWIHKASFSDCASLYGMMPGTETVLPLPRREFLSIFLIEHCPYWIRETAMAVSNFKESGREWQVGLHDSSVCWKDYIALLVDEWNVKYGTFARWYWEGKVVVEKPVRLPYCGVLSSLNSRASFCRNLLQAVLYRTIVVIVN
jgi:hypothetical protein